MRAILKGMALQKKQDSLRNTMAMEELVPLGAMPMYEQSASAKYEFGEPKVDSVPKMKGGKLPVIFKEQNFKKRYVDEYTGEELPPPLIRAAIEDELMYFNSKVWQVCSKAEMEQVPDHILVRCRWVLCNKGDTARPDVRARLVATEINKDGPIAHFAASTPPLEGKKALFAKFVSHRRTGKDALRISFVDIRKAYFNAIPERAIFMKLPPEMGLGPDVVARQVRCVYGTRDAGRLWEDTYTQVLNDMGFRTGISNPCVFYHPSRDISIVVHGDDFTALGTDANLNWYEDMLMKSFEIKIRGRIGEGVGGDNQIKILNRVVSLTDEGLIYEADPRHCDLLISSLNLGDSNPVGTPGVKPSDRDETAIKQDEDEQMGLSYDDPNAAIAAIMTNGDQTTRSFSASNRLSAKPTRTCEPSATSASQSSGSRRSSHLGSDSRRGSHLQTTTDFCDTTTSSATRIFSEGLPTTISSDGLATKLSWADVVESETNNDHVWTHDNDHDRDRRVACNTTCDDDRDGRVACSTTCDSDRDNTNTHACTNTKSHNCTMDTHNKQCDTQIGKKSYNQIGHL